MEGKREVQRLQLNGLMVRQPISEPLNSTNTMCIQTAAHLDHVRSDDGTRLFHCGRRPKRFERGLDRERQPLYHNANEKSEAITPEHFNH